MSTALVQYLPDGVSMDEMARLGEIIEENPRRAIIIADAALKQQVGLTRSAWVQAAQILYIVNETEIWKHHPDNYSTFYAWCQQPEIDIPPSVACDMMAIVRHAPKILEECDVDVFELIAEVGHSKIRQMVPVMNDAHKAGVMAEVVGPMLSDVKGSSFRDVIKMVNPGGQRLAFDLLATYTENEDGTFNVAFNGLSFDEMDLLATKVGVKRWSDERGYRIEPPTQAA